MSFKLIRKELYKDLNCTFYEYHHESGLRHFHIDSPFPEMNFNLALSTPPVDDTGIPHILEHLTLCGSHKYPEKDPFMKMNNRSVSHFMNAMTAPMHTYYPFSTTLEKDFFNLSDVYLDLIFNPLLRQEDFEQEGWRLENDEGVPSFKGVVLNEMKGVYSSPSWARRTAIMNEVAPNSPMRFSSGGHPSAIVHLDFERLKQFHQMHYRPEKAVLSTSGNFDISTLHKQIEDVVSSYQARVINPSSVISPPPKKAIQTVKIKQKDGHGFLSLPGDQGDKRGLLLAYVRPSSKTSKDEAFDVLMTKALFGMANPTISDGGAIKRLQEKHGISIHSGYDNTMPMHEKKAMLAIMVENIDKASAPTILQEIEDAFKDASNEGVSKDQWLSVVDYFKNQLLQKEDTSHQSYVSSIAEDALADIDPLLNSNNKELLDQLRDVPSKEQVKKWCDEFLSNKTLKVITHENQDFTNDVEKSLDSSLQEKILDDAPLALKSMSETSNVSLLPIIDLDDITIDPKQAGELISTPQSTNFAAHTHITSSTKEPFVRVNWSMGDDFTNQDKMVLQVFMAIAKGLGTKDDLSQAQINRENKSSVVGSWSKDTILNDMVFSSIISYTSSAPPEKFSDAIQSLLDRTAGMPIYEEKLFVSKLKNIHSIISKEIIDTSLQDSNVGSLAMVNDKARLEHCEYVYSKDNQLAWIENAIENPQKAYDEMSEVLNKVFTCPRHIISVGDNDVLGGVEIVKNTFTGGERWDELPFPRPTSIPPSPHLKDTHYIHQGMVNHCFRSMKGPSNKDLKEFATFKLAAVMAEEFLHENVRERGGAYGVSLNSMHNTILFSSFRDPNFEKTYQAFDGVYDYLLNLNEDDKEQLLEAKLSIAKNLLAPLAPSAMAKTQLATYLSNHDPQIQQHLWNTIKDVNIKDIKNIAKKWLSPENEYWDQAAVSRANPIWKQSPITHQNTQPTLKQKIGV